MDSRVLTIRFEVALLAKDGIYIEDFPRFIQHVSLPPGGRAELAVRCPRVGDVDTEHQVRGDVKDDSGKFMNFEDLYFWNHFLG